MFEPPRRSGNVYPSGSSRGQVSVEHGLQPHIRKCTILGMCGCKQVALLQCFIIDIPLARDSNVSRVHFDLISLARRVSLALLEIKLCSSIGGAPPSARSSDPTLKTRSAVAFGTSLWWWFWDQNPVHSSTFAASANNTSNQSYTPRPTPPNKPTPSLLPVFLWYGR